MTLKAVETTIGNASYYIDRQLSTLLESIIDPAILINPDNPDNTKIEKNNNISKDKQEKQDKQDAESNNRSDRKNKLGLSFNFNTDDSVDLPVANCQPQETTYYFSCNFTGEESDIMSFSPGGMSDSDEVIYDQVTLLNPADRGNAEVVEVITSKVKSLKVAPENSQPALKPLSLSREIRPTESLGNDDVPSESISVNKTKVVSKKSQAIRDILLKIKERHLR